MTTRTEADGVTCPMRGGTRCSPDLDNAAKSILDGLKGVAWEDDRQVAELHVYVRRGRPERVEVEVWEVDAGEGDVA